MTIIILDASQNGTTATTGNATDNAANNTTEATPSVPATTPGISSATGTTVTVPTPASSPVASPTYYPVFTGNENIFGHENTKTINDTSINGTNTGAIARWAANMGAATVGAGEGLVCRRPT